MVILYIDGLVYMGLNIATFNTMRRDGSMHKILGLLMAFFHLQGLTLAM